MRFRIKETRHTRNVSVDIDIQNSDEDFVGLLDVQNSPTSLKPIIESAWRGLKSGNAPELCEEGVGGTYFIFNDAGEKIAVFKPQDEEPYNINNPKGYRPRANSDVGIKPGILVGEASIREAAAYLLDHDHFAGVPVTDLVLCQHAAFYSLSVQSENIGPADTDHGLTWMMDYRDIFTSPKLSPTAKVKIGSFQAFVPHDGNCEDLGRSFVSNFDTDEVHKIAQLDIRLMNADRHGGNILYRKRLSNNGDEDYELTPIDHGFTIPSTLDEAWFEWLNWPQAKEPMSVKTLEYIKSLNVDQEILMLKQKFGNTIRDEHFLVLRIATMLLQKGAAANLTFFDIGEIISRADVSKPSTLEDMCSLARQQSMIDNPSESHFLEKLAALMDQQIQKSAHAKEDDLQFE